MLKIAGPRTFINIFGWWDAIENSRLAIQLILRCLFKGKHIGPIYLYHIKIGDIRIFHGGDSSYVSLKKFPSDVAFVPTGEPSPTCSPKKAFKMARDMKPQVAVAIHGSPSQHMKFKKKMEADLAATSVIIPNYFEPVTITLKK